MKTFRVSIPVMVAEEDADDPRILRDAEASPSAHPAFMVGFQVRAETARDAALILYERLESACGDP
jgi:hypothetical protein